MHVSPGCFHFHIYSDIGLKWSKSIGEQNATLLPANQTVAGQDPTREQDASFLQANQIEDGQDSIKGQDTSFLRANLIEAAQNPEIKQDASFLPASNIQTVEDPTIEQNAPFLPANQIEELLKIQPQSRTPPSSQPNINPWPRSSEAGPSYSF